MTTVLVVSDTHLSPRSPEAEANWRCVVSYSERLQPALVVHLGDVTLDGANDPSELGLAKHTLDRLAVDWRVVPGNHDIGDNPRQDGQPGQTISSVRRRRWIEQLGPDWWSARLDGWNLIGINAQLFESGLDAEAEQWSWLEQVVARTLDGPVALLLHKPLAPTDAERAGAPSCRFVPLGAADRIYGLLEKRPTPVVLSGHVHQFREINCGRQHVWAPTTWAVLADRVQPTYGLKRRGVVTLELFSAAVTVGVTFVEPPGLSQITLDRDIANPYER